MSARVAAAPSVSLWAKSCSQSKDDTCNKKFRAREDWGADDEKPTIKQLKEVARSSHLPFGTLFLHEQPQVQLVRPTKVAA